MPAYNDKSALLSFFRDFAEGQLSLIARNTRNYKNQASQINSAIKNQKDYTINEMLGIARQNSLYGTLKIDKFQFTNM